jgi:hypothetical protein
MVDHGGVDERPNTVTETGQAAEGHQPISEESRSRCRQRSAELQLAITTA